MIVLKGRQMTIPKLERYIGTAYDDNSEMRIFRVDRTATNGVDLSGLSFRLDLEYENGEKDTAYLEAEVQEEYILLMWEIINSVLQVPGTVLANIRATDIVGSIKWSSFKGAFYVEDNINTPGSYTGKLTELEQAEFRIDEKINQMEDVEAQRVANEEQRQKKEAERQEAEEERERLANTFEDAIESAKNEAKLSESWAIGGTGKRINEDINNSKYWSNESAFYSEEAKRYAEIANELSKINYPLFCVDSATGHLLVKPGVGVETYLDTDGHIHIDMMDDLNDGLATDEELLAVASMIPQSMSASEVLDILK